jgi:hypothetical protein
VIYGAQEKDERNALYKRLHRKINPDDFNGNYYKIGKE